MITPEEHAIQALLCAHQYSGPCCSSRPSIAPKYIRNVDGGVKATGRGWRRNRILSKDTALEFPVLLTRVALVFFCYRHDRDFCCRCRGRHSQEGEAAALLVSGSAGRKDTAVEQQSAVRRGDGANRVNRQDVFLEDLEAENE